MAKAALINQETNVVENVIVWDDTCQPVPGVLNVVVEDDALVSPGYTYNPSNGEFISNFDPEAWKDGLTNFALRALSYPPLTELADALVHQQAGDDGPMQVYLAKVQAVKDQYPL